MKRIIILTCIFLVLGIVFVGTGCTCYILGNPNDGVRGCGYHCSEMDCKGCALSLFSCACYTDDYDKYLAQKAYVAEEGIDFKDFKVDFSPENVNKAHLSIELLETKGAAFYTWINTHWDINYEICLMQDEILVGSSGLSSWRFSQAGVQQWTVEIYTNKFYNPNGGSVTFVLNHFSVIIEEF